MNAKERKRLLDIERKKGMIELLKKIDAKIETALGAKTELKAQDEAEDGRWLSLGCFKTKSNGDDV